jgi:murein DD-endopeptidase MepM/ murein hydrolase activator NlpD
VQADANASPSVTISKGQDAQSAQTFADVQTELEIQGGTNYEVVISTTVAPTTDTPVKVNVPAALSAQVVNGQVLVVYFEMPADEEQPAGYQPLSSNYDTAAKLISVTLPALAYQPQANGSYQAKLKIGIANGYSASSASVALMSIPSVGIPTTISQPLNIVCPANPFTLCVETSRFQPNRSGRAHNGVDLRAVYENVYAALGGTVILYEASWGALIVKDTLSNAILKYAHLSNPQKVVGDAVTLGMVIGISGKTNKTPIDPHLHFEVIFPMTPVCFTSGAQKGQCNFVMDYRDPFNLLMNTGKIVQVANPPLNTLSVNTPLRLALNTTDVQGVNILSDIVPVAGQSVGRSVLWTVAGSGGVITPETALGKGILNQATFMAKQPGQYKITAQWDGTNLTASYDVTVDPIQLSISPSTASVNVGATTQFTATAADQQGNPVSLPPNLQWASSNPAVATVSASGLVTGVSAGSVIITATDSISGSLATATVTVTEMRLPYSYQFVLQRIQCGTSETATAIISGGGETFSFGSSLSVPTPPDCIGRDSFTDSIGHFTLKPNTQYSITFSYSGSGNPAIKGTDVVFGLGRDMYGFTVSFFSFNSLDAVNGQFQGLFNTPLF